MLRFALLLFMVFLFLIIGAFSIVPPPTNIYVNVFRKMVNVQFNCEQTALASMCARRKKIPKIITLSCYILSYYFLHSLYRPSDSSFFFSTNSFSQSVAYFCYSFTALLICFFPTTHQRTPYLFSENIHSKFKHSLTLTHIMHAHILYATPI